MILIKTTIIDVMHRSKSEKIRDRVGILAVSYFRSHHEKKDF